MNRRWTARSAFTLIEVLIVIAIIVALTGLVGLALFSKQKEAKTGLAQADLNTISAAMKSFRLKYERWPTDTEGIEVLWNKEKLDPDADQSKWSKELQKPMPMDRWGEPWNYRPVSEHGDDDEFDLWSNGPDKEEGTPDDIVSWDKTQDGADGSSSTAPPPSGGGGGASGGR